MSYIECNNLSLGYDGKAVVEGLNFKIGKGDYLCVLGENGAGKSTLIKTILGLIDKVSGDIIYADGLKAYEIGYLPQQTVVQKDFPATVWEVVLSGTLGRQAVLSLSMERGRRNLQDRKWKNLIYGSLRKSVTATFLVVNSREYCLQGAFMCNLKGYPFRRAGYRT